VQPDGDGFTLKMGSTKGNAREMMGVGLGMAITSMLLMLLMLTFASESWSGAMPFLVVAVGGLWMGAYGYFQLPRWRTRRESQMEAIGRRAVERAQERPLDDVSDAGAERAPATATATVSPDLDLADADGFDGLAEARTRKRERS
jgi:hypothetical protein